MTSMVCIEHLPVLQQTWADRMFVRLAIASVILAPLRLRRCSTVHAQTMYKAAHLEEACLLATEHPGNKLGGFGVIQLLAVA